MTNQQIADTLRTLSIRMELTANVMLERTPPDDIHRNGLELLGHAMEARQWAAEIAIQETDPQPSALTLLEKIVSSRTNNIVIGKLDTGEYGIGSPALNDYVAGKTLAEAIVKYSNK